MTNLLKLIVPVAALALVACDASNTSQRVGRDGSVGEAERDPDPVGITVSRNGESEINPAVRPPEDPTRSRRRMDIDQLDTSIRSVTGGIGWTEMNGQTEVNLFESLASTLGKPDYLEITDEDLEPTAMFQKFLDDASRSVCDKLMSAEQSRSTAERTFFLHAEATDSLAERPEQVKANLQYLLLRFHGKKVAVDGPQMEPWTWLVQSAEHVGAEAPEVWRTVCVGLLIHPDFYTY